MADPTAFREVTVAASPGRRSDTAAPVHLLANSPVTGETRTIMERCAANLVAYQGDRTAARYVATVDAAWERERALTNRTDFSSAVAANLHKFLAYKDEYEVARMLTDPAFVDSLQTEVPGGAKLTYMLHPPTMKALGRTKKIGFGPRSHGVLKLLAKGKVLRGTPFDPFGYAHVRKVERHLVAHYEAMVVDLTDTLTLETFDTAVAAASAPDVVRGYEDVKLRNVATYVTRLSALGIDSAALNI